VEEIPMREEVLTGTFFLNEHPIIVLFDSGASRDFMSYACAERTRLTFVALMAPYMISTPRGQVDTDRIAQKVSLELSGRVFSTSVVVLSGQGIDVILGMRWMKLLKAILDIDSRLVHLHSLVYGRVTLHVPTISHIKASLDHVVELKLEDSHVI
jgi:predicted aspartyl protease